MFDSDYPIRNSSFRPKIGAGLSAGGSNHDAERHNECHTDWLAQLCLCVPQAMEAYFWRAENQTVKKFRHPAQSLEEPAITDTLNEVFSGKKQFIRHFSRGKQELSIVACHFPENPAANSNSSFKVVACVAVVFPRLSSSQLDSLAKLVESNIGWHKLLLERSCDHPLRSGDKLHHGISEYATGYVSTNISTSKNDPQHLLAYLPSKWLTNGTVDGGSLCASMIANDLASNFSCERVILVTLPADQPMGADNAKQRMLAISGISEVDPRQQCNNAALEIMNVLARYSDRLIASTLANDHLDHTDSAEDLQLAMSKYALVTATDNFAALSFTTCNSSRFGAIFEWPRDTDKLNSSSQNALRTLTENGLEVLALKIAATPSPMRRLRSRSKAFFANILGEGHLSTKLLLAGLAFFCAFAMFFPVEFRISAPITLEGSTQRAIVAPFEGYVLAAHVQAGMTVKAGQTLIELDQSKLNLERDKWLSEKAKLTREYDRALADLDQSQAQIIRAQIGQAQAELNLVDNKIARTVIHAPFDGVVISGDLSRSLGAPIARGDVLLEVAPLAGYRVVLSVDERDISNVALAQPGELTLNALPGLQWPFDVSNVASATPDEDGTQLFRVEARLTKPNDQLRPGMQGVGKILVGQEPLAYIFTRRFIGWLQLNLWSKLP